MCRPRSLGAAQSFSARTYHLTRTITISRSGTVILGAGPSTVFEFQPSKQLQHCANDRVFTTPCTLYARTPRAIAASISAVDASFGTGLGIGPRAASMTLRAVCISSRKCGSRWPVFAESRPFATLSSCADISNPQDGFGAFSGDSQASPRDSHGWACTSVHSSIRVKAATIRTMISIHRP